MNIRYGVPAEVTLGVETEDPFALIAGASEIADRIHQARVEGTPLARTSIEDGLRTALVTARAPGLFEITLEVVTSSWEQFLEVLAAFREDDSVIRQARVLGVALDVALI